MKILAEKGFKPLNKTVLIAFNDEAEEKKVGEEIQYYLENNASYANKNIDTILFKIFEVIKK